MTSRHEIEEKALLTRFQSGDRRAMDTIFQLYHPALIFFANRLLINFDQGNAQEVVLDVMLKTFELRETFKSYASIKAFLYISTKNKCLDVIEKEKVRLKRLEKLTNEFEEFEEENILSKIIHTEVLRELSESIDLLPEQCRNIMQKLMSGATPKEISEELNISISTVNSQKARAISILKKTLSNKGMVLLLFYI
ncbi:sigma-70 family RNA polymerase sigma factor [Chryseobacterium joostei]|uniref:RNA polymerase sigma-70 factor, ECF subfamily n=1 Tax=Chryseobacterium joostei TaxID=112234 RepID=A0A1N7HTG0_9FLAO|nr:sigma-70 family RNA polymerase sigma factor [Chryseobacterium joostei]AZA99165.1 sigma-70 family RNA polymerase sigma factor [Chryseobacterium joostei]SIS28112.1 RNA polymerase sigma-70 factor, ECF subfamily [Chryseobacterium joostei]